MNEDIRNLFPSTNKYVYLNSAAVSPLPTPTVDAVMTQLRDVSAHGSTNFNDWVATKDSARALLAGFLNVRADQVAFVRNTSDGFSTVANGISWRKGDNIVSFEAEFPSNFYPWREVRDRHGVDLRLCKEVNGRVDVDELLSLIDHNTKLVALSAVQFASGYRADLERIGEAARKADALFAVDVIQGLGAFAFDLPAQFVDIACGASHKWLFSPEGSGYIFLSDRARERVQPTLVGWISVETPWDFEAREQPFKPTALAWESGTGGAALLYGLEASLKILANAGLENVEKHVIGLADHLCELLAEKDYDIISSRSENEKSQIVCIKHRGGLTSNEIFRRLESESIIVSPRGDRLRIAPHLFNNRADIETLVEALP